MSTWTQPCYRSMPNQWAQSAINVYMDATMLSINAKPMGTISYQCLQGHKHLIDHCQTNGHNQLSCQRPQAGNFQCQTIENNLQLFRLEQGHEYSLAAIKAESLYQLSIFLAVSLKLGFNSVITSMLCYIYNVASNHNMDLSEL